MCEHHHAAKHILCPQCDMLVALPRLSHGQKAACPRCGATLTTEWDAPRQRPTAYALAALFMLLLSNLFPFVNMNVAGVTSEVTLLEIPGVMFSEDYASLGTICPTGAGILPGDHSITCQPRQSAVVGKKNAGKDLFPPQIVGNGRNISRRGVGQFC